MADLDGFDKLKGGDNYQPPKATWTVTVSQTTVVELVVEAETEDDAIQMCLETARFEGVEPNEPEVSNIRMETP